MDMRDVIPWSLIYGELNRRHKEEIETKDVIISKLRDMILMRLIDTIMYEIQDHNSRYWKDWFFIRDFTTISDIERVSNEFKNAHRELYTSWLEIDLYIDNLKKLAVDYEKSKGKTMAEPNS